MYLYDLQPNDLLKIHIRNAKVNVNGIIKKKNVQKHLVLIEINDIEIKKNTSVDISFAKNGTFNEWKNQTLICIDGYKNLYLVSSQASSVSNNRRNSFRIELDKPCKVSFERGNRTIIWHTNIFDISLNGFSFIVEEKLSDLEKDSIIKFLEFSDEEISLNVSFDIRREVELEDGGVLYGCRYTLDKKDNRALSQYISKKQAELARIKKYKK